MPNLQIARGGLLQALGLGDIMVMTLEHRWGRARRMVWPAPSEAEVRLPRRGGSRFIGPCEQ